MLQISPRWIRRMDGNRQSRKSMVMRGDCRLGLPRLDELTGGQSHEVATGRRDG